MQQTLTVRAGYRYPVFIENRLLAFNRYTEPNVCVSNKISIHSLFVLNKILIFRRKPGRILL